MRMMTNFDKVLEFHEKFNAAIDQDPENNPELVELRMDLITEEFEEVMEELNQYTAFRPDETPPSKTRLAKELADLLYVAYGTAVSFGIPLDLIFHEVHKSNLSKLDEDGNVAYRPDGKVLKGPRYHEPQLEKFDLDR